MMNKKQSLGRRGEELVARYYEQRGFTILERNWRCRAGEVDLIAEKGRCFYIIEVKTRTNLLFGQPEEAITAAKQQRLRTCAALYMRSTRRRGRVHIHICSLYEDMNKMYLRLFTDSGL